MSKIEWTQITWNPISGCGDEIISPGCENCYARRMAKRLAGRYGYDKKYPFSITVHPRQFEEPFIFPQKPTLIFVCSMGDLFHKGVSYTILDAVFRIILDHQEHYFLILTKRPVQMREYIRYQMKRCGLHLPIHNLGLGVTACNQAEADEKIPILLETPAAMRFVSIEPMLGPVDFSKIKRPDEFHRLPHGWFRYWPKKINWIIVGPETGPKARPCQSEWVEEIHYQCNSADVPFFLKSWNGKNCDGFLHFKGPDRQVPDLLKSFFKEI